MSKLSGEQLLDELHENPDAFYDGGRAYDLLKAYFGGLSHETLRELLRSPVSAVQRSATFILSELGRGAADVVDDAIPLLDSNDRNLIFETMEALTVCSEVDRPERFALVLRQLENDDWVLRKLAMYLASNVSMSTIQAAQKALHSTEHAKGLAMLTDPTLDVTAIATALDAPDPLLRRYAAIAARRSKDQALLLKLATSDDPAVQKLATSV